MTDLGARDRTRRQIRPATQCIPTSTATRGISTTIDGKNYRGFERAYCPSDEYRGLLSPETLARMEGRR